MIEPDSLALSTWFAYARQQLEDADAQVLCEAAFEVRFSDLIASTDRSVTHEQVRKLQNSIDRRQSGEPVAYIVGRRGFWRHEFFVSPATLIPRPETETLVELVLPCISDTSRVLDLGTGSGAIGLSIASESDADVLMSDISSDALAIASKNAEQLAIDVQLRRSNWYEAIDGKFDYIVSNPPYVASNDEHLARGDLRSEPRIALDGGEDGLVSIRSVVTGAVAHLRSGGHLAVEHGFKQADEVGAIFRKAGFNAVELTHDLSDLPRVTHGTAP